MVALGAARRAAAGGPRRARGSCARPPAIEIGRGWSAHSRCGLVGFLEFKFLKFAAVLTRFVRFGRARGAPIEEWSIDYNTNRPHTSLNGLTPTEFATRPNQGPNPEQTLLINEGKLGSRSQTSYAKLDRSNTIIFFPSRILGGSHSTIAATESLARLVEGTGYASTNFLRTVSAQR